MHNCPLRSVSASLARLRPSWSLRTTIDRRIVAEISDDEPEAKAVFNLASAAAATDSTDFSRSIDVGRESGTGCNSDGSEADQDEFDDYVPPSRIVVPSLDLSLGTAKLPPKAAVTQADKLQRSPPPASNQPCDHGTADGGSSDGDKYSTAAKLLHRSEALHMAMLKLLFSLLLSPSGLIDPDGWNAVSASADKEMHVALFNHLNHSRHREASIASTATRL